LLLYKGGGELKVAIKQLFHVAWGELIKSVFNKLEHCLFVFACKQPLVPTINHQSPIINHQSSIINHQSSIISHQSSIANDCGKDQRKEKGTNRV